MGYYADLIKEKKEKQNSIVKKGTFNKGTYTIDKTTGMFGRTVYIVHAHYEKGPSKDMTFGSDSFETLQDAQKYADRLNSKEEKDNYEHPFEYLIKLAKQKGYPDLVKHLQEHKMEYLKDTSRIFARIKGLEGLPDKTNSKEEKDNASVQDKFSYKGCLITILKKGEGAYTYSITQDGREEGTNATYSTQDEAERKAKREVEVNWNEKEKGYYAKLAEEKASRKN